MGKLPHCCQYGGEHQPDGLVPGLHGGYAKLPDGTYGHLTEDHLGDADAASNPQGEAA